MKIFLTGMMGSGKTYWMQRLGEKMGIAHFDLDELITAREQRSVSAIFDESGETYFRGIESATLKALPEYPDLILATGGGTPCFHDNMRWMNQAGLTIWLDEPVEVLVERLLVAKEHRPLVASFDAAQIRTCLVELKAEREPFYKQAAIILRGDEINEAQMVSIIKNHLNA